MRGEIARGAAWMVLMRLLDRMIGVVSTALLARLLIPADFGLVAMAMSIIAIVELATAFSFEVSLIQKSDPQRSHYDTAWTLNVITAAGAALVMAALALPAAAFYGDPRLAVVMWCIAAAWLLTGFQNIGIVDFQRRLNFAAEFRFMLSKRVFAFLVTVAAALWFRSYWALVIGMAAGRVAGLALSFWMSDFRPRLTLVHARELITFSGWILGNNVLAALLGKAPHFIVGRAFGAQSLGAYTVGAEVASLAHTELIMPINRAMFPGYSRLTGDMPLFRQTCIDATGVILLVVFPVSVGIAVLAAPFVRLLLGSQWGEAVAIIQVLAVAGAVTAITSNSVSVYLALGRPWLVASVLLPRLLLLAAIAIFFARDFGLIVVAWAELAAAVGSLAISLPVLFSVLALPASTYFAALWRPVLASVVMGALIHVALPPMSIAASVGTAAWHLGLGIAMGALVYPVLIAALWWLSGRPRSAEVMIAGKAAEAWGRLRSRAGNAA
jgi:lipopolysaccharide exporter